MIGTKRSTLRPGVPLLVKTRSMLTYRPTHHPYFHETPDENPLNI